MKKTVQVLMLPNTKGYIDGLAEAISDNDDYLFIVNRNYDINHLKVEHKHLYFTSNEELNVYDFFVYEAISFQVAQVVSANHLRDLKEVIARGYPRSKVIATTDKFLNLPLIPQSFIEEYISKNGEIKEVDLLYTPYGTPMIDVTKGTNIIAIYSTQKKQTLEEAAKDYTIYSRENITLWDNFMEIAFIAGAKWQQSNS